MSGHVHKDYRVIRECLRTRIELPFFEVLRFVSSQEIDLCVPLDVRLIAAVEVYERTMRSFEVCGPLVSTTPLDDSAPYSPRADIVWTLRSQGKTLKEIAESLHISGSRARQLYMRVDHIIDRALNNFDRCDSKYVYDKWFHFGPGEERLTS